MSFFTPRRAHAAEYICFDALMAVDRAAWRKEVIAHEELFIELHDHLPPEMIYERELLICKL